MSELPSSGAGCPFVPDEGYIPSTNLEHLQGMKMNYISPAANTWKVTHPDLGRNVEHFSPWLAPDNELAASVANRKRIYYDNPDRTCETGDNDPEIRRASQQLLEIQTNYLASIYPDTYSIVDDTIHNHATGDAYPLHPTDEELHPLAIAGLLGQEDLCLVRETDDGRYVMIGGFLASPTNWHLSMFMNMDMDGIHGDVAGYTERLKRAVDSMLEHLPEYPDGIMARNNMFYRVDGSQSLIPDVNPPVDHETVTDPGSQVFLRSERETLTRLPSTEEYPDGNRYVVFSIKPHVYPLEQVVRVRGRKLVEVIRTNSKLQAYPISPVANEYIRRSVEQ